MDPDAYLCQLADIFNSITVHTPSVSAIIAIVLAGVLLLASGFASASEIAFFSLSPSDLNSIEEGKHPSDEKIRNLLDYFVQEQPASVLTVQEQPFVRIYLPAV